MTAAQQVQLWPETVYPIPANEPWGMHLCSGGRGRMKPLLLIAALCFLAYRWRCREVDRESLFGAAFAEDWDDPAMDIYEDTYVAALARKGMRA